MILEPIETENQTMVFKITEEMQPQIEFNYEDEISYILKVDKDIYIKIEFIIFE